MRTYFNPADESDKWALPTLLVEHYREGEAGEEMPAGFYWSCCVPGCLPDSDLMGPFATEAEAIEDAREGYE